MKLDLGTYGIIDTPVPDAVRISHNDLKEMAEQCAKNFLNDVASGAVVIAVGRYDHSYTAAGDAMVVVFVERMDVKEYHVDIYITHVMRHAYFDYSL